MAAQKKRTEIAELGEFGLIDRLTARFAPSNASTQRGAGDDRAELPPPTGERTDHSTDTIYEVVDSPHT